MSLCSIVACRGMLLSACCLLALSALYAPVKVHGAPVAPLNMKEVRALKRLIHRVERDLSPAGKPSSRVIKALIKTLPRLVKLEQYFARYLHHSSPTKQRGVALMARSLFLRALHERQGLLSMIGGRLCLRAEHRAKLAGALLTRQQPRQAIEQLQRGASCTTNPQPFWDEAYLIARASRLPELDALSLRASEAVRRER